MQPQFMTQSLSQLPGQLQAAASHPIPQSSSIPGQLPPLQLHPQASVTAPGPNQATGQLPGPGQLPNQAVAAFSGAQAEAQQHGLLGTGQLPQLGAGDQSTAVLSASHQVCCKHIVLDPNAQTAVCCVQHCAFQLLYSRLDCSSVRSIASALLTSTWQLGVCVKTQPASIYLARDCHREHDLTQTTKAVQYRLLLARVR